MTCGSSHMLNKHVLSKYKTRFYINFKIFVFLFLVTLFLFSVFLLFPFYWIYWGDTGEQNHTGFRCTFPQHNFCTLYCVLTTPSQVSFVHTLSPLYPSLPTPDSTPSRNHHCCLCPWGFFLSLFSLIPQPLTKPPNLPYQFTFKTYTAIPSIEIFSTHTHTYFFLFIFTFRWWLIMLTIISKMTIIFSEIWKANFLIYWVHINALVYFRNFN